MLHFLLMLGSLELGQAYAVDTLTKTQRVMLSDLRDYGMVYQRKQSSSWFYPTRLATSLTSDTSNIRTPSQSIASGSVIDKEMASDSTSFIILETNYKLYAYTGSPPCCCCRHSASLSGHSLLNTVGRTHRLTSPNRNPKPLRQALHTFPQPSNRPHLPSLHPKRNPSRHHRRTNHNLLHHARTPTT